jgi:transcriptional regulator with XRE-family HTH domain
MAVPATAAGVGELLREWRKRRNVSQFELASRSAVSARHLSFIETGRSRPSREMVLHLAQRLDVPIRQRNRLLLAAGFAPVYGERGLDDAEMAPVRAALERFLAAHEPYPALVVDHRWTIIASNDAVGLLTAGVAEELLRPPANALRISLHPDGMAPRIANLEAWAAHLLERLRSACDAEFDPELDALYDELASYYPSASRRSAESNGGDIALLHELLLDEERLSLISTLTRFSTAHDVTLAGLAIEAFYPADEHTAGTLAKRLKPSRTT